MKLYMKYIHYCTLLYTMFLVKVILLLQPWVDSFWGITVTHSVHYSWKRYVKLAMRDAWLWQVYANSIDCLPLWYIDCHRIGQMNRELGPMQKEWNICIGWFKFDSWNQYSGPRARSTYNWHFDAMLVELKFHCIDRVL